MELNCHAVAYCEWNQQILNIRKVKQRKIVKRVGDTMDHLPVWTEQIIGHHQIRRLKKAVATVQEMT
jgi:hypothetical protein